MIQQQIKDIHLKWQTNWNTPETNKSLKLNETMQYTRTLVQKS